MKQLKSLLYITMVLAMLLGQLCAAQAAEVPQKSIRIGFFSSTGFHEQTEEGTFTGYGYDLLQMLLRYKDWKYQYIGYEKNWGSMMAMLDSGEIDVLPLANKTPERMEKYAFTDSPIGYSSTVITMSEKNKDIIVGDTSTYANKRIGFVTNSSHNSFVQKQLADMGISYEPVYYESISQLLDDLRHLKNIDIAVTSNMRDIREEIIIDEVNATNYYFMVRKADTELLRELNSALKQLNVYSPNWRTNLFQKYYGNINSKVISFSASEREYLAKLKADKVVIKAAMNPELRPYSYFVNGEARGIAPRLFKEICQRLGLAYEILPSKNRMEYKLQLNSGQADVDLTAFLDYGLAQKYHLKETDAYIVSTMAMLKRRDASITTEKTKIAVVSDPTEYIGYNNELIYKYNYEIFPSIQACIDAVKSGRADATFQYVYVLEQAVQDDYTGTLQYTVLGNYPFSLAIGVNNAEDHRLLSVLNKGVGTLSNAVRQTTILEEASQAHSRDDFLRLLYSNPLAVIAFTLLILVMLFFLAYFWYRDKNSRFIKKQAEDFNLFISYICSTVDAVTELDLRNRTMTRYTMKNDHLDVQHIPYPKDEWLAFHPEDRAWVQKAFTVENLRRLCEQDKTVYNECRMKWKNSEEYHWCTTILRGIKPTAEKPFNLLLIIKDTNELKENEAKQRKALEDAFELAKQASIAKGTFLSKMSHEIRTPLNAIIGYLSIAQDQDSSPEKLKHCVDNSAIAAHHLLHIINDVLDMSAIESGKMKIANEPFDLKHEVTEISTIFFQNAKAKGVGFKVNLSQLTDELLIGDSLRLKQVLMNLLSNAVKFTPEGGLVQLGLEQLSSEGEDMYYRFTVTDDGIGMSDEYMQRLFKPFEQESASTAQKYGGSGLGLSITRNLVALMGGTISVKSQQGEGTTFTVTLHFNKDTEHKGAKLVAKDYAHIRALVVDDAADEATYVKSMLKRCGVKATSVNSGADALKRIRSRMGTEQAFDLCIVDWKMPEMDGLQVAAKIREEFGQTMPIIVATAYDVAELEDQARAVGVNRVVAKPLFQSTLFDLLVSSFGRYEPSSTDSKGAKADLTGVRVLLAEDNAMNMEIAVNVLTKHGVEVDQAVDGQEAYDKFTAAAAGTYSLILMDIQMPKLNGYEATRKIRESSHPEAKTIPIIAMTANAFTEDVAEALANGMNAHIAKPVDYDKLFAVLNKYRNTKIQE